MWLLSLLLLCACNQGFASECIDSTLKCTHRRVPFPTRKDLPETREALNKICRDQNEYYDCLQNIPGEKSDGDVPPTADKLNRLDAEYMLSELCTEGLKTRNNYLKHAVCINKQKTDVCTSPEFLIILLANEKAPSRCSIQNKVISCISMMLAMNCGAEAGFLYRRLLHIAADGDVHCNSGEDLGEVFALFNSAKDKDTESPPFASRFGEVSVADSSKEHLFHRLGEIAEGAEPESVLKSEASSNVVQDYEQVSEKTTEAGNSTFQNDAWNGMEFGKNWLLQTVYGRLQPVSDTSNIEDSQDVSNLDFSGPGQRMCSPFEVNSKRQTVVDEQCFDKVLEHIVETKDHAQESDKIYMKSDDADEGTESDEINVPETSSITEMYADTSAFSKSFDFQKETSTSEGISSNQDPLTVTRVEFSEHEASQDSLTNDNLRLETVDGPKSLKDYEQSFNEQDGEIDSENEGSYNPVDILYPYTTEFTKEETSAPDLEYSTVGRIDETGSIDSVGRNIYTITDIFDLGSNTDESKSFENTYFVDEQNIVSKGVQGPDHKDVSKSYFENEDLEKQHEAHDALKEIVKRIGEIEVEFPGLESQQYLTNKTSDGTETLPDADVLELRQYSALVESDKNEFQSDFQRAAEDSISDEDSSGAFSGDSFEAGNLSEEIRDYFKIKNENTNLASEIYENHQIEDELTTSESIEQTKIPDRGSGSLETDKIQDIEDLKQTSNSKLQHADFSASDVSILEVAEDVEAIDAEPDEIGSGVPFMYESESSSSETGYISDLNSSKSSTDSQAEGDQYVTLQEYVTFEEKDDLKDEVSSQGLTTSNEDKYFSSTEIENLEGSSFYELPAADTHQEYTPKAYELVNDPAKDLPLTNMNDEYSVSSDNDIPEPGLDSLKLTAGAVDYSENYEFQKTETSTDSMIESLKANKPDLAQNEQKHFDYDQPIIIKLSDEDVRKYYELKPHEPQDFLSPADLEREKLDFSEMYYVNEDSSKFRMKDFQNINVPKEEYGYEEVILEPEETYSGNTENEPVDDVPVEDKIYSYELLRELSRRSLNTDNTDSTHLSEDSNTVKHVSSPQSMHVNYETSATIPAFALESLKLDNAASNIFNSEDLVNHAQYSASDDTTLEEEDELLTTEDYLDAQNTEAASSDLVESIENPEEIIMNHLDSLLQGDAAGNSGDSIVKNIIDEVNQEELGLETRESVTKSSDEANLVAQLIEEQSKCHRTVCEQSASNKLLDEGLYQEDNKYRTETNKIKTLIPQYSEKFLMEKLTSNKVYMPRDPVFVSVNENDSKVFIRDVEQVKIPCLQLFNVPNDSKYFECYIDSREPTYVYLPNFTAFE